MPNQALHRGDVIEAPAAEVVFHIHQFFGEVIQVPRRRVAVDGEPGGEHFRVAFGDGVKRAAQCGRRQQAALGQRL